MERGVATTKTRNLSSLIGEGLTKVYHTGEVDSHALRGADFELRPGELCFEDYDFTSAGERELFLV